MRLHYPLEFSLYKELEQVFLSDDKISFKYAINSVNETADSIKICGFDLNDVLTNPSIADVVEELKTRFINVSEKTLVKFRENYDKAHK